MNNQKEQYGEHRLIDLMNQLDEQDARAIREHILQTINDFIQDAPQHDDITMVIIKALA
jgi:serine phosphatase RsbU (regulator of sigma subunit)